MLPAKTNELVALQEEQDAILFKDHQLKEVLDKMCALDMDFDQMISRLSSIQGIWNMVGVYLVFFLSDNQIDF